MKPPQTLFEKIWNSHVVIQQPDCPAVLYIDLHLVHEVTSPQAFESLRTRGLGVRRPQRTAATVDHAVPTLSGGGTQGRMYFADDAARQQVRRLEENCAAAGIPLYGLDNPQQGIVHVIGPELGLTRPGMTIVCGDSHTSTHGAFGALAFGIGTSEVEHVLATQCLLQYRPRTCQVNIEGRLQPGVSAKDIILALIAHIGVSAGQGFVFEYTGSAVRALDMEERMTVCNMSIEAGARAGMIAPDDTTFSYLASTPHAKDGRRWEQSLRIWRSLPGDEGAVFDHTVHLDASSLEPMITFGTHPGMVMPVTGRVPLPEEAAGTGSRGALEKALNYMGLTPGQPLLGHAVDAVFIGSCTNGRLGDLRQAAKIMKGRRVAPGVRVLVVPGSQQVKRQAEAEGLHHVFLQAGAEWRQPGCSLCIAMNGDQLNPGETAVSTSNRNFEGRQGKGSRTFLSSPLTAAAAAVCGVVSDPRSLEVL